MQDFKKLRVWRAAHRLTLRIYDVSGDFPSAEVFGLRSQIRRAAVSIAANIAEGCGRDGRRELSRFLHLALGSASELEYHLVLVRDLQLITEAQHQALAADTAEVKRMLVGLINAVRGRLKTDH